MHKKLSEKFRATFPAITRGYSMVKFAHLHDAFFEGFLTASKPIRIKANQWSKKKRKGEKGKAKTNLKKYKSLTWKDDVGLFLVSKF